MIIDHVPSLEVTLRRGKALAAYLHLSHPVQARSVRTEDAGSGIRIDFDVAGAALGIEITAPTAVDADMINALLSRLGVNQLDPEELAPLRPT